MILNRTFLMLRALSFSSMMILMSCLVLVFIKVVGDGASSVYSASLRGLSASIGGRSCVFLLCNGILGILVLCSSSSVPSSGEEDCDHDHDVDVIQKLLASNVKGDPEVTLLLGRSGAGEEPQRVCHCKIRHLLDGASQQQDNKVHSLLFLDPNLFHIEYPIPHLHIHPE